MQLSGHRLLRGLLIRRAGFGNGGREFPYRTGGRISVHKPRFKARINTFEFFPPQKGSTEGKMLRKKPGHIVPVPLIFPARIPQKNYQINHVIYHVPRSPVLAILAL
jgi:hypothetical protein